MDIWHVDVSGYTHKIIEDTKIDETQMVDGKGSPILDDNGNQKSISFDYGTIESYRTQKIDKNNSFDVYKVRGDDNAKAMFEFMSKSTNVEWSLAQTGISGHQGLGFLTSSHQTNSESGMTTLINRQLKYGYTLRNLFHNHPENTPYPSGIFGEKFGDIYFAKMVASLFKQNIQFKIFLPNSGDYVKYDPNSTFEDFENVILLSNKLPEIIVTPK